jgi:hypothetical protein
MAWRRWGDGYEIGAGAGSIFTRDPARARAHTRHRGYTGPPIHPWAPKMDTIIEREWLV